MKIKLSQIINSKEALEELIKKELPIKISYRIQKVIRVIEPEYSSYDSVRHKLIVEKYGEENPKDSGSWKVKDENTSVFYKELEELLSEEIDIDVLKIKLPDDITITPSHLYLLSWLVDVDEEE